MYSPFNINLIKQTCQPIRKQYFNDFMGTKKCFVWIPWVTKTHLHSINCCILYGSELYVEKYSSPIRKQSMITSYIFDNTIFEFYRFENPFYTTMMRFKCFPKIVLNFGTLWLHSGPLCSVPDWYCSLARVLESQYILQRHLVLMIPGVKPHYPLALGPELPLMPLG